MSAAAPRAFADQVRDVQEKLADSAERAGLRGRDPYGAVIEAQSQVLGLFPQLLAEIENTRRPWAEDERRAVIADAVAKIDARVGALVAERRRWREIIMAGALAGAVVVAGIAGYRIGYRGGAQDVRGALDALPAAAVQYGPGGAEKWLTLMRYNDVTRVWDTCREVTQEGRRACVFALWTSPPVAAPPR